MNSQKIAVLTDSCGDIPNHLAQKYHIFILPLRIAFKDGVFSDGVDITPDEVYDRMRHELPKTSLPDGNAVLNLFEQIKSEGYTHVFALMFSGGLSGTYQFVQMLAAEEPDLVIDTYDTRTACLGSGAIALQVAEYIQKGRSFAEIQTLIPRLIENTSVFFCIDTLEYLYRGGRIGKIASIAGTMLQIKPVIGFNSDGELASVAKIRGRKQSMEKIVDCVCKKAEGHQKFNLMFAHGGSPEEAKQVKKMVLSKLKKHRHCFEGIIDCTLASHVGPHLIGAGIQILDEDM